MLLWKRYSGVSPDRRLFTFCTPGSDPLAKADGGAALDDGDVTCFPAVGRTGAVAVLGCLGTATGTVVTGTVFTLVDDTPASAAAVRGGVSNLN